MGEGKADTGTSGSSAVSTPETMDTHTGSATATHGANTNLDPNMQGGPDSAPDRAATQEVEDQHAQDVRPE